MYSYGYESEDAVYEELGETDVRNACRRECVVVWLMDNANITYVSGE